MVESSPYDNPAIALQSCLIVFLPLMWVAIRSALNIIANIRDYRLSSPLYWYWVLNILFALKFLLLNSIVLSLIVPSLARLPNIPMPLFAIEMLFGGLVLTIGFIILTVWMLLRCSFLEVLNEQGM